MLAAAIVAVGALGFAAPAAPSSVAPLRVSWDGPPSCPSASVVRERVDSMLAGSDAGAGIAVRARARQLEDRTWTVELEIASEDGQRRRTIPGGLDCTEAAEAAAVVIAISIDPQANVAAVPPADQSVPAPPAEPEPEPEPEPSPQEPEPAAVEVLPPLSPETEADPDSSGGLSGSADAARRDESAPPLRGLAAIFGGVGFGNLPTVAGVAGVEAGVLWPRARVTAAGQYWFRSTATVPGASVDFRQWSIAVRGCPVFPLGTRFELLACGGIEAGQTIVRAQGTDQPAPPSEPWIAWLVQPGVVVLPLPWLGLRASVELYGPFIQASYELAPSGELFAPSPVATRGVFAVEFRLP